jgi:hypothetical protein
MIRLHWLGEEEKGRMSPSQGVDVDMSLPNQRQDLSTEKEDSHKESSSAGAYKGKDSFSSDSQPLSIFNEESLSPKGEIQEGESQVVLIPGGISLMEVGELLVLNVVSWCISEVA